MTDLARHSVRCGLQEAFAIATRTNRSEPLVRLAYAKGCATFACNTHPRTLMERVETAQAEVVGTPRPDASSEVLASAS